MLLVWGKFLLCALIIYLAGSRLTKYGDAIAEKTGLCRAWVGLVLLAAITSLPELANTVSATAFARLPDLAAGDLLGACLMNMFGLSLLDLLWGSRGHPTVFIRTKESNKLSALFGVLILLAIAAALALARVGIDFSPAGISVYSVIILGIYLLSLYFVYQHRESTETIETEHEELSLGQVWLFFLLAAVAVVAAGSWLPFIGAEIVEVMGWGRTFVAIFFLALATTLPEMTVSFAALRLGQAGMAVGNFVGSNVFNVSLIFIGDLFYRPASLYSAVSPAMLIAALFGAGLMGIVYLAMVREARSRFPSLLVITLYLTALFFLYRVGALS